MPLMVIFVDIVDWFQNGCTMKLNSWVEYCNYLASLYIESQNFKKIILIFTMFDYFGNV
jgi:hypothetical protein